MHEIANGTCMNVIQSTPNQHIYNEPKVVSKHIEELSHKNDNNCKILNDEANVLVCE